MNKLSDRFKKAEIDSDLEENTLMAEENLLLNDLLEKVNSVPYWNEYTYEQQCNMVRYFVKHADADAEVYNALLPFVTGFGALQKLLDNEKVSAVFVNEDKSVHIEIEGKVFDTDIILSQNMLQYLLNFIKEYTLNEFKIYLNGDNITIRKTC